MSFDFLSLFASMPIIWGIDGPFISRSSKQTLFDEVLARVLATQ